MDGGVADTTDKEHNAKLLKSSAQRFCNFRPTIASASLSAFHGRMLRFAAGCASPQ